MKTLQKKGKAMGLSMPSFDEFWEKGYVQFPEVDKKNVELYKIYRF